MKSKLGLKKASWDLALGQSVGNPEIRNQWETESLFQKHSCVVLLNEDVIDDRKEGTVEIAFPIKNTNWAEDGISHLLCQIMGGQVDINHIEQCKAIDIYIPDLVADLYFKAPKYGITGFRQYVGITDRPLFGGIMKPKTGLSPEDMLEMTKQMVYGGVDFIKEDEILSNPHFCPLEERVDLISNFREKNGLKFVFAHCINGDPHTIVERAKKVHDCGGNGVHINIWSGLGSYNTIRQLDLPLYIHYQKSGDKVITHKNNPFGISWKVLVKLAALCGVDTIHTGMWGGYLDDDKDELKEIMEILVNSNVVPALSCGMHPGLVEKIRNEFGTNWMANVGGAIHGHPDGTRAGASAMRQAIDREYLHEYGVAVNKWGISK